MAEKKGAGRKGAGGVRKMVIGGREYPCRVTMGAMLRFKRATGKDVSRMNGEDMEELMVFVHSCVASACKADGVPFELGVEDMADCLTAEDVTAFYEGMVEKKAERRGPTEGGERGRCGWCDGSSGVRDRCAWDVCG